jgi:hypothetical protein
VDHRLLAHRDPSSQQVPPRQKPSKKPQSLPKCSKIFNALVGIAVDVVRLSMALLSFRGFDTPSLPAQGEQRRSFFSTSAGTSANLVSLARPAALHRNLGRTINAEPSQASS